MMQAVYHDTLANGELLTDVERDVLRWAGNSAVSRRSLDTLVYKKATAFEILVGCCCQGCSHSRASFKETPDLDEGKKLWLSVVAECHCSSGLTIAARDMKPCR